MERKVGGGGGGEGGRGNLVFKFSVGKGFFTFYVLS